MRWFFIHIPKNAGMSIRYGLRGKVRLATRHTHVSHKYTAAVTAKMRDTREHPGYEHARWRDIHPRFYDMRFFAIVRNPWARVVSRYFYSQMVAIGGRSPEHRHLVTYPRMTFEEFLEERHRWGNEPYYWHRPIRGWYQQLDYVTDKKGRLRCDILRCERLAKDLKAYMDAVLPSVRRNVTPDMSGKRPYQQVYTPKTIQIVADWYAKDIDFFGFDFDSPATRNVWATSCSSTGRES